VGGQLLNFEVTVGLGRLLLQKRKEPPKEPPNLPNFKLPWAQQRPKGTKKTWT
jgi:hypothetical protein